MHRLALTSLLVTSSLAAQPEPPREFRAAWVATVDNIDWPSRPGLPVAEQQRELTAILDCARELRLNALIFQVRSACDALYPSELEPWSEWLTGRQGRAPDPLWDPLRFAVDGAHARGLELHAWFNPFRARHREARSESSPDHVSQRVDLCVTYGAQLWLDPGVSEARDHSLQVILDVVDRYDIDGVHVDDYFYPYPVAGTRFPDGASYEEYRRKDGKLNRPAWRRQNVDLMIEAIHRGVHERKSWVKFGISPFGIARPGLPPGIEAGIDQYDQLYADVRKWLANGWCDYFSPQLYWPIDQRPQSYSTLLSWWAKQNPQDRHLWIGNYTSQVARAKKPWPVDEIIRQVELTRSERGANGNVHFSMKALLRDAGGVATQLRAGPYSRPALIPASSWLDDDPPERPQVRLERTDDGVELYWIADADARWRAFYLRSRGRWELAEVLPARTPGFRLRATQIRDLRIGAVAVAAVDRCGNEGPRLVLRL